MTRVDLHPEDLFDRLRTGELRIDERERLQHHCECCSACAFELQLIESGGADSQPSDLDHVIAARAIERMLSIDEIAETTVRVPARSHGAFRAAALMIAGLLVGGSVSAAALTGSSPFVLVDLITAWVTPAPHTKEPALAPSAPRNRKPRIRTEPKNAVVEVAEPSVIEPVLPPPIAAPVAPSTIAAPGVEPPRAPANTEPATWFFRAASHARAEGRYHEALALYGVLRREFAGSEAEVVARVAVGRLCLSQLDDAPQALEAFNSYLEARPEGPLAEEARSGRVGALRKLGRDADAEAAMSDLIGHHPHSLYAPPTTARTP